MNAGIALCFLGALSFGLLGSVAKAAERRQCNAFALVAGCAGWGAIVMFGRTLAPGAGFSLPGKAAGLAIVFGICAAVAFLAFQISISIGKVTVGWLMMNLSAGVPVIVSIWVYKERLTPLKLVAFALAVVSVLLLFRGNQVERREMKALKKE
ncbi:MAG: EamA family transporter [Terriglobia bacterium]